MTDKLDAIPGSTGRKIIDGLKDAVAGNFASVTIEGQRWVRADAPEATEPDGERMITVPYNPCLEKLRPGEPFFVLLGRDKQAPESVLCWADARERAEGKTAWTEQAREVAQEMTAYSGAPPACSADWTEPFCALRDMWDEDECPSWPDVAEVIEQLCRRAYGVPPSAASTVTVAANCCIHDVPLVDECGTCETDYGNYRTVTVRPAAPTTSPEPDAVRALMNAADGQLTILDHWAEREQDKSIVFRNAAYVMRKMKEALAALSRPAHGGWHEVKPNSISQDGLSVCLHLSFPTHKEAAEFRVRTHYRIVDGDVVVRVPISRNDRGPTASRCPHCDDTGDVHRADGEWLGSCDCKSGATHG